MFAGMIFAKEPFFKGIDNNDQMVKIAKVLGTQKVYDYCSKFGVELSAYLNENLSK